MTEVEGAGVTRPTHSALWQRDLSHVRSRRTALLMPPTGLGGKFLFFCQVSIDDDDDDGILPCIHSYLRLSHCPLNDSRNHYFYRLKLCACPSWRTH